MKFKNFFLFFILVFLGFSLVIYLFYQIRPQKVFQILFHLSWWQIIIIFLINIFILLIVIKKWQILTKPCGYKSSIKKLLPAFLGEWAISYLTPVMYIGGEGFKAYLVNKNEKQSFMKTFSLIIIDRLAEGVALLLFFIIGGIFSFLLGFYIFGFILLLASITVIILILVVSRLSDFFLLLNKIFKFYKIPQENNHYQSSEEKIKEEIKMIKDFFQQRIKFFNLDVILSFFSIFLTCGQIYLLMLFWGYQLNFFKVFLIRSFSLISGLFPTPGSLGGFEGAMALIFTTLDLNLEHALSFALVTRGVQLTFVIFGILFIIPHFTKLVVPLIFKNNQKMLK